MKAAWKMVSWQDPVQKKAIMSSTRMQRKLSGNSDKNSLSRDYLRPLKSISVNNQGTPTSERDPHYHYLGPSFKDTKPSENTQTIYQ